MSSIFGILNTGRLGLSAHQSALSIIGNNIANVNTPGYSQQRADLRSLAYGGVKVRGVERFRDDFVTAQLRGSNARMAAGAALSDNLQLLESMMAQSDDAGLSKSMSDFFSALQDLTLQPAGTTEREAVLARARQLTESYGSQAAQLRQFRRQIDDQLGLSVDRINALTEQIAGLNGRLGNMAVGENGERSAELNQMLDSRDQLINELSGFLPVNVVKDPRGTVTIFAGGSVLIEGQWRQKMTTVVNPANDGLRDVAIEDISGNVLPIQQSPTEGSLGALLLARDKQGREALVSVDRLAAQMIRDFNLRHRQGLGLDGAGGRDFFTGLAVTAAADWRNRGTASVTQTAVLDQAALDFNDYEIRFTAADRYDVVNTTTGETVSSDNAYASGSAIEIAGMRVVIESGTDGPLEGDVFNVNAYSGSAERMDLAPEVKADARAIAAGQGTAPGDNLNILNLAALRDTAVMGQPPTQTFEAYLDAARLRLSMEVQNAQSAQENELITQQQLQGLSEAVSGVSLDDQATNIVQYQRGYEASSRVIRMTDELLQTILQMV